MILQFCINIKTNDRSLPDDAYLLHVEIKMQVIFRENYRKSNGPHITLAEKFVLGPKFL